MEDDISDPIAYSFITEYLKGFENDTVDFTKLQVRQNVAYTVRLIVFLYSVLIAGGFTCNLGILYCVTNQISPRHYSSYCIANLAIVNVVKCIVVLPISLINSTFKNWIFGDLLCYILPMLQEMPLHVTGWTYYLIAYQQIRLLQNPCDKQRSKWMVLVTWLIAFIMVLPYRLYVRYIDFGKILKDHKVLKYQFDGVGICFVKSVSGIREYLRGIFIVMCLLPLLFTLKRLKKTSETLSQLNVSHIMICYSKSPFKNNKNRLKDDKTKERNSNTPILSEKETYNVILDLRKEKISLKYLILMVIMEVTFLLPLKLVRLLKFAQNNIFDVTWNFDLIFIALVWFAFLPTCIMPLLYASWQLSL